MVFLAVKTPSKWSKNSNIYNNLACFPPSRRSKVSHEAEIRMVVFAVNATKKWSKNVNIYTIIWLVSRLVGDPKFPMGMKFGGSFRGKRT